MSDARTINDDAKFDADIKFSDKRTRRRFTKQGGNARWMSMLRIG